MLSSSRFAMSAFCILQAFVVNLGSLTAIAQEPTDLLIPTTQLPQETEVAPGGTPSPFGGPLFERAKLTGDWLGTRSAIAGNGITLDVSNTQYHQGVTSGGIEQAFRYGGRNDYFLNVDGEKVGLSQGLFITLHGETRYGESANSLTGALLPTNFMLAVP